MGYNVFFFLLFVACKIRRKSHSFSLGSNDYITLFPKRVTVILSSNICNFKRKQEMLRIFIFSQVSMMVLQYTMQKRRSCFPGFQMVRLDNLWY